MINKLIKIALVGNTNAGKSTFMNSMVGQTVSIINKKINTTQNMIMGIVNISETQIIFYDTPGSNFLKTKDFFRKVINTNKENIYHHIGIYAFSKNTLSRYVNLSRTKNEIERKLEQMRALDNNIEIRVALSKSFTLGIDTKEDFLLIKKSMEYKG